MLVLYILQSNGRFSWFSILFPSPPLLWPTRDRHKTFINPFGLLYPQFFSKVQTGRAMLSRSGFYTHKVHSLLNRSCFYHNTTVVWTEGVSLLEDHTSEIIYPQNRENPLWILPYLPTLLHVSALYGVKVQKYVICMAVCKCTTH